MKVITISGSPTENSSTDILLAKVADGISAGASSPVSIVSYRLHELSFIPCQACAKSPEPEVCFYEDDLWPVYQDLIDADIVLVGSPIFFDSVSGPTKMFIDRCSCFRPPDFAGETGHHFKKLGFKRRIGAGILVAGEGGRFDLAQSILKGFFKWTEIDCQGFITYQSLDFRRSGAVADDPDKLNEANKLGLSLGGCVKNLSEGHNQGS